MKRVKWSLAARKDIERIREFVSRGDADNFPEIAAEIVKSARFVANSPKMAPMVGSTFQRKWPVKRFPYLIFFRVHDSEIWIMRVRHSSQDWWSELI